MSVLEELRKKAEEKKAVERQQEQNLDYLEQIYTLELLPKMQFLYDNLNETIEYLNFLEEPLLIKNYGSRFPQFGRLLQKEYKMNTDGRIGRANYDRLMQINISFSCEGPGDFSYSVAKNFSNKEKEFLTEKRLTFTTESINSTLQRFTIKRKIPVTFSIKVDYEQSKLDVIIDNYENLESFSKSFSPEELNEEFLDSLLSYFIRKDNRFVKPEITEHHKIIIQNHIEPYQQQQRELLAELAKEKAEQQKQKTKSPLFSLKKLFKK
jgi:hypothetical protein